MLELRALSAGYGSALVLREITLHVAPGEIVALIGANGAGKSTLVRAISGLVPARQGEILFAGTRIDRLSPGQIVARGIGHVPEGRQVFPEMSVHENLLMGGFVHRRAPAEMRRRAAELCRRFPVLQARLGQPAGNLSGGQQQILAIARGLMAAPRLLILDEPSLGLAPVLVGEIFALIAELRAQGLAVLLSEQNARQSLEIADRGYALAHGRIVAEGKAADLLGSGEIAAQYLGGRAEAGRDDEEQVAHLQHQLAEALGVATMAAATAPPNERNAQR